MNDPDIEPKAADADWRTEDAPDTCIKCGLGAANHGAGWADAKRAIPALHDVAEHPFTPKGEYREAFNDDMIRRGGLPSDVMGLIHDLCYHHDGRSVRAYVSRAREILKAPGNDVRDESKRLIQALGFINDMAGMTSGSFRVRANDYLSVNGLQRLPLVSGEKERKENEAELVARLGRLG